MLCVCVCSRSHLTSFTRGRLSNAQWFEATVPFGVMLLLSRVVVGVTPGLVVFASIFSGSKVPLVDETTGKKALKY